MRIRGFTGVLSLLLLVGWGCGPKSSGTKSPGDPETAAPVANDTPPRPLGDTSGAYGGHSDADLSSKGPRERPASTPVDSRDAAIEAARTGNPDGARDFLVEFVKSNPKDDDARIALARALGDLGKIGPAVKTLDGATLPGLVIMRSRLLQRSGRLPDAIAQLERALKSHPKSLPLKGELVAAMIASGRRDDPKTTALVDALYDAYEAAEAKSAEQLFAVAQAALARGTKGAFHDANMVFDEAEEAAEKSPGTYTHDLMLLTRADMFREKYAAEEAITTFDLILKRDAWNPHALAGAARTYVDSLQFAPASRSAQEALAVDPDHTLAHAVLARIALIEGRREEARERISKHVLSTNPNDDAGLAVLAALAIAEGDQPGYGKWRDAALQLNPSNGGFYKDLSDILGFLHLYPEADTILREGVKKAPTDAYVHAALGLNLLRLGKEAEARAELNRAWKKDPFNERTRNLLDLYEQSIDVNYSEREVGELVVRLPKEDREFVEGPLVESVRRSTKALDAAYHVKAGDLRLEFFRKPEEFSIRTVGVPSLGAVAVCFGPVITFIGPYHGMFNLENVVRHELAHVYAIRLSKGRVPRWFTEGLSEWESELADPAFARESAALLQLARKSGKLRRLSELELAFIRAESPQMMEVAYSTAAYAVRYLGTTYGRDKLIAMLKGFADGKHTEELVQAHLGKTLAVVEKEFEAWFFAQLDSKITGWQPSGDPKRADERDALLARAQTQVEAGDRASAIRSLEELVTRDGDGFAPRMLLAKLVLAGPKPAAAKRHLEAARGFHKESVEPLVMLSEIARTDDRPDDEKKLLTAALAIDGDSLEPAARLLMLGLVSGDKKATALGLRRCRTTAPLHPISLAASALAAVDKGDKGTARKLVERSLQALGETQGGPADTFVVAALAADAVGDKTNAQALAKTATKLGKLPSSATKRLGLLTP